jgi:hypothetical protein
MAHLSIMLTFLKVILASIALGILAQLFGHQGGLASTEVRLGNAAISSIGGIFLILLAAKMVWTQSTSKGESLKASLAGPIVVGLFGALLHSSSWAIGVSLGLVGTMVALNEVWSPGSRVAYSKFPAPQGVFA